MNLKILVLDDNENDLFFLGRTLKTCGIVNAKSFTNTDKFLSSAGSEIEAYIIDFNLNGPIDGLEVIREIKQKIRYGYFIMLSGDESFETVYEFQNLVYNGEYILKGRPDTEARLKKCLEERYSYLEQLRVANDFMNIKRKGSQKGF